MKVKTNLLEAIALSSKINDLLTEHYDKRCSMIDKGYDDYFSLNEKFIKKIEKVIKNYKEGNKK